MSEQFHHEVPKLPKRIPKYSEHAPAYPKEELSEQEVEKRVKIADRMIRALENLDA